MRFRIDPMEQAEAEEVATWRYPGEYAFYNADADADDLAELLDADRRAHGYFTVRDERSSLVGFFQFKRPDTDTVEGTQKIVPDLDEGLRRINDYSFPLEDARAQAAYGIHSAVNKVLVSTARSSPSASPSSSSTRSWGSSPKLRGSEVCDLPSEQGV